MSNEPMGLDPRPFRDLRDTRYSVDAMKFAYEFAPRPEFEQDRQAYQDAFPNEDWERFDFERAGA